MSSRFVPPPNALNQISPRKAKRSFSDISKQSIFHELKKSIRDKFTTDVFEQVGAMNAIVLEVIDKVPIDKYIWKNPMMSYLKEEKGVVPDYIEIRFRIPELHAHLPEPENEEDWAAINRHPTAVLKKDKSIPAVGDIVVIDFQDKNNFTGAQVIDNVNSSNPPGGGGICKPAATFAAGTPSLNVNQPTGDDQSTSNEETKAENDPAKEAETEGIEGEVPPEPSEEEILEQLNMFESKLKRVRYIVDIDNFNSMTEFLDASRTAEILHNKQIFSVCFVVADGDRKIKDIQRLKEIISTFAKGYIDYGFLIRSDGSDTGIQKFRKNYIFLSNIMKEAPPRYIIYEYLNETMEEVYEIEKAIENLAIPYAAVNFSLLTEKTSTAIVSYFENTVVELDPPEQFGDEYVPIAAKTRVVYSNNHWDYNIIKADSGKKTLMESSGIFRLLRSSAFYLGGINFLKDKDHPCLYGERTPQILYNELSFDRGAFLLNYERLEGEVLETVISKLPFSEEEKQNFLSSKEEIKKAEKAKLEEPAEEAATTPAAPEEPAVNNTATLKEDATKDPTDAANPENKPAEPGMTCTPFPGGGMPMPGGTNGAVAPPTMRFDEIPNYQDLAWKTTSKGMMITNVILDFMNKFSAALYARIPMNDPIFTGASHKKVNVSSTLRTPETQVRLMWDKMNKEGENGVWKIYGKTKQWVIDVVTGWQMDKRGDPNGRPFAINSATNHAAAKAAAGGRGHGTGTAVDIHTWSHIDAEGHKSSGMPLAQLKATRYVTAVVEAAIEAGGKPLVEEYQQHVHITIL